MASSTNNNNNIRLAVYGAAAIAVVGVAALTIRRRRAAVVAKKTIIGDTIIYRLATPADATPELVTLINWAYRGKGDDKRSGWTGESKLVSGTRTDLDEVTTLLKKDPTKDKAVFVAFDTTRKAGAGGYVGCIKAERTDDGKTEFGMFGVDPDIQGGGIGKKLFGMASDHAKNVFKTKIGMLCVLNCRSDIQAWYSKLGYKPTGEKVSFPPPAHGVGSPLYEGAHFMVYEKVL